MRSPSGSLIALAACGALVVAGCDRSGGPQQGAPGASGGPGARGAPPPPPAESAARPGACKGGGGEVKDAVSAPFFPRLVAGYCVNPDGETESFGEKTPRPVNGICKLFDGGCQLYIDHQVKRTVSVDYVDGGGGSGSVNAVLSQFGGAERGHATGPENAYAMFTRRVLSDEDAVRPDMPRKLDAGGAQAALGTGSLYAFKGAYLLELSYVNTEESGDEKRLRASGERVLPGIARGILEKLPGLPAPPPSVERLPPEGLLPLGVSYADNNALGVEGTGPGAVGFYRDGDRRYRMLVLTKDDPDQARDIVKTFAKRKGAQEEKNLGEGAVRLMIQEQPDGPKAEWILARRGRWVLGVGDEPFALKPGESAAEHEKACLSRDDKLKKLRPALDAAK